MEKVREIASPLSRSSGFNTAVGEVVLLDSTGDIVQAWRPNQAACTIGADSNNDIRVTDGNLAGVHAQIVFGKNRTLLRSMEGQLRIAGRVVRETLIDEPTTVQCGSARLLVVPVRFVNEGQLSRHRVTSGTIADQANRLRSQPKPRTGQAGFDSSRPLSPSASENPSLLAPDVTESSGIASSTSEISARTPTSTIADLTPLLAALEPIQEAIVQTQQGIDTLHQKIAAVEARERLPAVEVVSPNVSEFISRFDERIGTFTTQCQSLLSNAATNFEDRFQQLGDLVQRLTELPPAVQPHEPYTTEEPSRPIDVQAAEEYLEPSRSQEYDYVNEQPFETPVDEYALEAIEAYPSATFEYGPSMDANESPLHASNPDSVTGYAAEDEAERAMPPLPDWFTKSQPHEYPEESVSESIFHDEMHRESDNLAFDAASEIDDNSAWMSARLNPIYAEDTGSLFEESEPPQDDEAIVGEAAMASYEFNSPHPSRGLEEVEFAENLSPPLNFNDYAESSSNVRVNSVRESEEPSAADETSFDSLYGSSQETLPEIESTTAIEEEARDETKLATTQVGEPECEDGEESIEDYMQRLLQRVKGGSAADAPSSKAFTKAPSTPAESAVVPPHRESSFPTPIPRRDDPSTKVYSEAVTMLSQPVVGSEGTGPEPNYAPRTPASNQSENMAALRELANVTARTAIQKSSRKRTEIGVATKFCISMMGLAGGLILLFLNGLNVNIAMMGMVCSFIVCLLWGYEASVQVKQLAASNEKQPTGNKQTAA